MVKASWTTIAITALFSYLFLVANAMAPQTIQVSSSGYAIDTYSR